MMKKGDIHPSGPTGIADIFSFQSAIRRGKSTEETHCHCVSLCHSGPMVAKASAVVQNEAGIHCRPSAHIVKTMADYTGSLKVTGPMGGSSDLQSMLSLMMLALTEGTQIELEVDGPDEEETLTQLVGLFEFHYDFPQDD